MTESKHQRSIAPAWKLKALNHAVVVALSGLAVAPMFAQAAPSPPTSCASPVSSSVAACTLTTTDSLSVTNTGVIASAAGVSVSVDGGATGVTVTNAGTIGDGTALNAINVDVAATGTQITNQTGGVITSVGNGNWNRPGAIRFNGNLDGSLTNNGSITSSFTGNSSAYARGVYVGGDLSGTLTNNGTISATATAHGSSWATAWGVHLNNGDISGILTNNGTISATATNNDNSGMASAYGVRTNGLSGTLTNSGTITATAHAGREAIAYGVYLGSGIAASGNFTNTNTGSITASATAGNTLAIAYGVYLDSVAAGGSFTNRGTTTASALSGNAGSANAYGVFVWGSMDSTLTNSGTISATASNPNLGYSLYIANGTGTIDNQTGGLLSGNLRVGGSVAVNNAGTISIPAAANGASSAYIGGNFTNTGTYKLGVTDTQYGQLNVGGTATLGGRLFVDASTVTANNTHNGTLTGIISAGSLSGTFASFSTNSLLFSFTPVYLANEVDLTIAAAAPRILQTTTAFGNMPAAGAAGTLDNIITNNPTGNIGSLFQGFTTGQERQLNNAVSQTLPLLTGGGTVAAQSALTGINRAIQARIDGNRGLSSGEDFLGDKNVWMKPFGSWADQNDRNGVSGFKANTYGLILGADGTLSPALRVGAAFAYANSDVNGQSSVAPQSAKVDVFQLVGYGSYNLDDRTAIDLQAAVGQNTNKGQRQIAFASSVATSNYNSDTAHVGVGLGRTYSLSSQTSLTPSVRADYTWIKEKAYAETGAGALNLNVNSRTTDALVVAVDGKLAHQLNDQTTLIADLGVGYDTINKQAAITSAFAGAPDAAFVTYGIKPSPWLARGGAGTVYKTKSGVEITARYDAEYRESFVNQTASVKARWAF